MNKIVLVGRSSSVDDGVPSAIKAHFGESCLATSWSDYADPTFSCCPADLFVLDLTDASAKEIAIPTLAHRSPEMEHSLAIVPADLNQDLLLAITRQVDDVLPAPCSEQALLDRVRQVLDAKPQSETEKVSQKLVREFGLRQIIGEHPSIVSVLERVEIIARVELPALIFGETGTGKELCARAIHALSARRDRPFVPVECGAIPVELAESEIFGHARGAYTDARSATLGVVGMAEGGTLFLDEIDSLSLPIQAKLLRFLQEGTYRSLGSDKYRKANVRIIAASNRSLGRAVKEKAFRDDLFFRLSVLRVDLPALRERKSDIPLLATHFLEAAQPMSHSGYHYFNKEALAALQSHHWPGNVRELSNVINRAVLFSGKPEITARDIVFDDTSEFSGNDQRLVAHDFRSAKTSAVNAFEKQYLNSLLEQHGGNISRAANAAGQDRSAFRRLLKKHGIATANHA